MILLADCVLSAKRSPWLVGLSLSTSAMLWRWNAYSPLAARTPLALSAAAMSQ